jgi:hypothetical protein
MSLLLLLLLGLGGCNRDSYDTPVKAYQTFHRAVQRREPKIAYGSLSKPTQDALQARAQTVALFFANVPPPADVTEVTLLSEEGDVAQVGVVSSTGKSQVRMVREPSGWKVDLTESLQQP